MALRDLLYRCPECGRDPVEGRKDRVRCPSCGAVYERGGPPALIRVTREGGETKAVHASRLVDAIREMGGPLPSALGEDGALDHVSEVRVRRATEEEGVRYRGRLLGFTERLGEARSATLRLAGDGLELRDAAGGAVERRWNVLDLRAVQASSSALQIYSATGELVHFRFVDESPLRWEALLHVVLRRAYREAGKGEIVEFQPRIAVR